MDDGEPRGDFSPTQRNVLDLKRAMLVEELNTLDTMLENKDRSRKPVPPPPRRAPPHRPSKYVESLNLSPRGKTAQPMPPHGPFLPAGLASPRPRLAAPRGGPGSNTPPIRGSFMGPCPPLGSLRDEGSTAPRAASARPSRISEMERIRRMQDQQRLTTVNQMMHRDFYGEGLLETYPQFSPSARRDESVLPTIQRATSSRLPVEVHQRCQKDMERTPDDLAAELKGRALYSDIMCNNPPMPGFYQQPNLWPVEWYYKNQEHGHTDPVHGKQVIEDSEIARPKWKSSWSANRPSMRNGFEDLKVINQQQVEKDKGWGKMRVQATVNKLVTAQKALRIFGMAKEGGGGVAGLFGSKPAFDTSAKQPVDE